MRTSKPLHHGIGDTFGLDRTLSQLTPNIRVKIAGALNRYHGIVSSHVARR
jgi:hypothetical protein